VEGVKPGLNVCLKRMEEACTKFESLFNHHNKTETREDVPLSKAKREESNFEHYISKKESFWNAIRAGEGEFDRYCSLLEPSTVSASCRRINLGPFPLFGMLQDQINICKELGGEKNVPKIRKPFSRNAKSERRRIFLRINSENINNKKAEASWCISCQKALK
jgi:hypothetical protein